MFKFTKYHELDFTLFVCESSVPIDEIIDTLHRYVKTGITKYELHDFRMFEGMIAADDIQNIVEYTHALRNLIPAGHKVAILVAKQSDYGMSRMYQIFTEVRHMNWETQVFYSLDEAMNWLGVDLSKIPELL